MTPERLRQLRDLFEAAIDQDPPRRAAFLAEATNEDPELRAAVQRMLEAYEQKPEFLNRPAAARHLAFSRTNITPLFLSGTILAGRFEIVALLGRGGMGEVYHARDRKLSRSVALKVIAAESGGAPIRKRRILQEARAASALNHPNIATVYDIAEQDGVDYIAMEYVRGKTLDKLIPTNGLNAATTLRYAVQIADALSAAHAAGIVHRDVKPGNIMITERDSVKVLDFGLAKLVHPVSRADNTTAENASLTVEGSIIGTVSYMSPEQAAGKSVDARSDIFSFGSVLYEMLSGRRPFNGDSKLSTLAAILQSEPPPMEEVAPAVPVEAARVVMRCLRKDPLRRFQSMDEVRSALESLQGKSATPQGTPAIPVYRRLKSSWLAATALGLVLTALIAVWLLRSTATRRGELTLRKLTSDAGLTTDPALSPDGKLIAYASDRDGGGDLELWVQQVAGGDPVQLTNNDVDDASPAFSPDSTRIAFRSERAGGGIYLMSALGGHSRLVAEGGRDPKFSPDGNQLAYWTGIPGSGDPLAPRSSAMYVMSLNTGLSRRLRADFAMARNPIWCSDGSKLLFSGYPAGAQNPIEAFDAWVTPVDRGAPIRTGMRKALADAKLGGAPFAWYGDALYLTAVPGDTYGISRAVLRQANPVFSGPLERLSDSPGQQYGASFDGTRIALITEESRGYVSLLPTNTVSGKITGDAKQVIESGDHLGNPSISMDGTLLAYGAGNLRQGVSDIFVKRMDTGSTRPIANTPDVEVWPKVLPDGSAILYEVRQVNRITGLTDRMAYRVSPNGGDNRKLCDNCGTWGVSPNGEWLVSRVVGKAVSEQSVYQISTGRRSELLRREGVSIFQPNFSNDGHWLVFLARFGPERARLFVARFQGLRPIVESDWVPLIPHEHWRPDTPRWSPDDGMIYFTAEPDGYRCIYAQRVNTTNKQPEGDPFAVYHSHSARRSLLNAQLGSFEISVSRGGIVFLMGERTANIWLATLPSE